ncbi:MAG: hypothetical protein ACF8SC_04535 [Phycisphaerales bacterium JB037]
MPMVRTRLLFPAAAALAWLAAGCASRDPRPVTFTVASGRYADAIDAATRVLSDRGYEVERIDARNGVVTSRPKPTTGLLTPFDDDQSGAGDEWQDFVNVQRRTVRIVFEAPGVADEPGPSAPAAPVEPPPSVASSEGPWVGRIEVVVERRHRPNRRIEPESIRRSTRFGDPELASRGMAPEYFVAIRQDPALAGRLARAIEDRLGGPAQRPSQQDPAQKNETPAEAGADS